MIGCSLNNTECINRIFKRDCICMYGFNGDGYKYCDGKVIIEMKLYKFEINNIIHLKNVV
jgi:hypothetical protein